MAIVTFLHSYLSAWRSWAAPSTADVARGFYVDDCFAALLCPLGLESPSFGLFLGVPRSYFNLPVLHVLLTGPWIPVSPFFLSKARERSFVAPSCHSRFFT